MRGVELGVTRSFGSWVIKYFRGPNFFSQNMWFMVSKDAEFHVDITYINLVIYRSSKMDIKKFINIRKI
jgi:uncharacterized protein (DUF2461 family)